MSTPFTPSKPLFGDVKFLCIVVVVASVIGKTTPT